MNKLLLIAAFFLGSQVFISCSKNEASKTKEELLTMGGWRLDSKQKGFLVRLLGQILHQPYQLVKKMILLRIQIHQAIQ